MSGSLLKSTDPIIDVLFIEEVHGNIFRRIGVERVFDRKLIAEFDEAEERDVLLV